MNLPDLTNMDEGRFIMWVCAAVLVYVMLLNPLALSSKLDAMAIAQANMISEHKELLRGIQAQCINHAENVDEREKRAKQLHRCLTLDVRSGIETN